MAVSGGSTSLAQALVDKQIITAEQLARAEQYRQEHGTGLEQALEALQILSEDDLGSIYGDIFQMRSLKLEDVEIDRDAVRHVPAAVAHRHHLIPVRRSGNALAVAMADPLDPEALRALEAVTDFDIIPFVARYDAIEHAIYVHYGDPAPAADSADSPPAESLSRPRALFEDDRSSYMGRSIQVNRQFTFDRFVADSASEFPLNVSRSIAEQQAEEGYNPFHMWGPSGSGKTHLLHAIANHLTAQAPLKRHMLTTGRRFVDDLFQSIRDRKINFFRYLYRELDLLMIDEADVFITCDWAQRELLETIRHLRLKNRRVILASVRNLAAEPRLQPDLRDEIEAGVSAAFGRYSERGRIEIARRCAGNAGIAAETLQRVVRSTGDNIADLVAVVQHMTVIAVMGEGEVTADIAEDLMHMAALSSLDQTTERTRREPVPGVVRNSGGAL